MAEAGVLDKCCPCQEPCCGGHEGSGVNKYQDPSVLPPTYPLLVAPLANLSRKPKEA